MGQLDQMTSWLVHLDSGLIHMCMHVCVQPLWLWLWWSRWSDCTFSGQFCGEVDVLIPYSGEPTVVYLASYFLAAAAGCALTCCLWLPNTLSVAVSDRPQHASVWRPGLLFMCPEKEKKTPQVSDLLPHSINTQKRITNKRPQIFPNCYNPGTLQSSGVISFFHFLC